MRDVSNCEADKNLCEVPTYHPDMAECVAQCQMYGYMLHRHGGTILFYVMQYCCLGEILCERKWDN